MKRCGKGFTLIELLVVIAIIAILAAILFPVFIAAKQRAASTKCLNNEKQLAMAFRAYMDDNNGWMPKIHPWNSSHQPPAYPPDWVASSYPPQSQTQLPVDPKQGSLWPYTKNLNMYMCGADKGVIPADPAVNSLSVPREALLSYPISYTVNRTLVGNLDRLSSRHQSRLLLLLHEGRKTINDGIYWWEKGAQTTNKGVFDDTPSNVHYSGTNACFADCHVVYLTQTEIYRRRDAGDFDVQ